MSETPKSRASVASRLARLDTVEVEIEKLVAGGEGLARFEGIPIFVPVSAPGDRLVVRLVERHPDYGRGEIVELVAPGPGRRAPPCPYFGECGGCDLQHLEDAVQLELKVEAARETLHRLGGLPRDLQIDAVAGLAWAYRRRTQLHTEGEGEALRVGYRARRSRSVVAVDACPILVPELERQLPTLKSRLPSPPPRRLDLIAGDGGAFTTAPVTPTLPHGQLEISVGGWTYEVDARCFFQGHRQLLSELIGVAVGPWEGDCAYDLYAGVGLFSLPLSRRYRQVVAVEGDRIAVRYARRNARQATPGQVEVVISAVESWIAKLPPGVDRVVVDPPRVGLSRRVREQICAQHPRRLTYVSCHPAALARDLFHLVDRYQIERVALVDMFPQTGHVELIVQLVA